MYHTLRTLISLVLLVLMIKASLPYMRRQRRLRDIEITQVFPDRLAQKSVLFLLILFAIGRMEMVINGLTAFVIPLGGRAFLYEYVFFAAFPKNIALIITQIYHLSQDLCADILFAFCLAALAPKNTVQIESTENTENIKKTEKITPTKIQTSSAKMSLGLCMAFFIYTAPTTMRWIGENRLDLDHTQGAYWLWFAPVSSILGMFLADLDTFTQITIQQIGWWMQIIFFFILSRRILMVTDRNSCASP